MLVRPAARQTVGLPLLRWASSIGFDARVRPLQRPGNSEASPTELSDRARRAFINSVASPPQAAAILEVAAARKQQ
jgi:hypothetical protein